MSDSSLKRLASDLATIQNVDPGTAAHLLVEVDLAFQLDQLDRILRKLAKTLSAICDWLPAALAAEGIAELEMDLKLRSEVGLRTDLLALFDP